MAVSEALIERREYKYLVDDDTVDEIRRLVAPYCVLDENAARQGGTYLIDSLYLDTPRNDLFWANDHEVMNRFKLRVRTYPVDSCTSVFVEVKKRNNDVICKTRGQLPKESWSDLVQRPSAQSMMSVPGKSRRAVERFVSLTHSLNATPRVLVRYEREPYMSVIDDYARVTFDRKVLSKRASKWELELPQETWRPVDNPLNTKTTNESLTILELKFTSAVPLWMTNLVRRLQLQRLSFSKYATSVVAWHSGAGGYTWDKRTVAGW